jgi:hypothetical protein
MRDSLGIVGPVPQTIAERGSRQHNLLNLSHHRLSVQFSHQSRGFLSRRAADSLAKAGCCA